MEANPSGGLSIPVVWAEEQALHEPGGEVFVGVHTEGTELPARAEAIRAELEHAGAAIVPADPHPDAELLRVHSPALLGYLAEAWERWAASGLTDDPGQGRVVPYLFPTPALLTGLDGEPVLPEATHARAGRFAYDTMTLIGPGTWRAARAAADAALTAVDLVAAGEDATYACCRPPGHHVTREAFGGSCYLNNAAIAAAALRERLGATVAALDLDAHHGNGTQSIFYEDGGMSTGSVHVDPAAGWFPYYLGFASEGGRGPGEGANLNLPLAPGTGDEGWLAAVERLAAWAGERGAGAIVVALGVDAAAGDPESPLRVSTAGYRSAGEALARLGRPAVIVQEGGYDLETIGPLVRAFLEGFARP